MSNALSVSQIVLNEFAAEFVDQCTFLEACNVEYNDKFGVVDDAQAATGVTVSVKRPQQFTVRKNRTQDVKDIVQSNIAVTADQYYGVDCALTDVEFQYSVGNKARLRELLRPAAQTLASEVNAYGFDAMYKRVNNILGTPGTTPSSLKTFNLARGRLTDLLCPDGDKVAILDTNANAEMVEALKGLLSAPKEISKQYVTGMMGNAAGLTWMESAYIPTHTVGALGGTPLVKGASQGTADGFAATTSLVTDGWTAAAATRLKAGDVVTLDGVYDVHPLTKKNRGYLKQFVVTADAASSAGGELTAILEPAIIYGGPYQNVSNVPADNTPVNVVGAANTVSPQNLIAHKSAFTMVSLPLEVPTAVEQSAITTIKGVSIRMVRAWDQANARTTTRFDTFFGFQKMTDWAVRVAG